MNTQELILLMEYNNWANKRILQRSARLSREQLIAPNALSHGSLLKLLVHLADTEWSWRACCQQGKMPVEYITETQLPDVPALKRFSREEFGHWRDYLGGLTEEQAAGEIEYSWPRARPRRHPLWQVVMHVVNHGTQHRSEAGFYLTGCGQSPGNIDFIIFASKHKQESTP